MLRAGADVCLALFTAVWEIWETSVATARGQQVLKGAVKTKLCSSVKLLIK